MPIRDEAQRLNNEIAQPSSSVEIARRLLARDAIAERAGIAATAMVAAALERSWSRVFDHLRDAMGEDGSRALVTRAIARVEPQHPALQEIRGLGDGNIHVDGITASVDKHGAAAVTAAIEAALTALVDILAGLIGEDMAIRLIGFDGSAPPTNGKKARAP